MSTETPVQEPSINDADRNSLAGLLRFAFKKMQQEVHGVMPARVIAFKRGVTGDRVQVVPTIKMVGTNGAAIDRAQIANIPVLRLGGGGFGMSYPLKPGDLGWIFAADRDISGFLQNYGTASPQTNRMGEFSDSFFIPDQMTGFTHAENEADSFIIQKADGSVKIKLEDDTITIEAPNIIINSNAKIILAAGSSVEITGDLKVIGNIKATGDITPNAPP